MFIGLLELIVTFWWKVYTRYVSCHFWHVRNLIKNRSPTRLRQDVLDTTLCDKLCQWLAAGQFYWWRKPEWQEKTTDRQDITEILLKVALNTIILTHPNKGLRRVQYDTTTASQQGLPSAPVLAQSRFNSKR